MDRENDRLDALFIEYRKIVIRNAYLFVKDYYIAEDICQETFIRLERNLGTVPPEKVKGWLLCVSERLAIDYLRKGGKYKIHVGLDEAEWKPPPEDCADVSSQIGRASCRERV